MEAFDQFLTLFNEIPHLQTVIIIAILLLAAWIGNLIVKRLLIAGLVRAAGVLAKSWEKQPDQYKAIRRLANVVPALIIMGGVKLIPHLPTKVADVAGNLCAAFIALTVALSLSAVIDTLNKIYSLRPEAKAKPIKGYLQVAKIVLFLITAILMASTLVDRSPLILLSGLGAMAAVLMLIFQDTLLSLVASVQISSSDMVRVGDWIEMPNLNADGDVIDIALHTVKVQNWDKTITTLPTRRLITDPFKNWRGMHESGGRRIKRSVFLDQNSVGFLSETETACLKRFYLLEDYLTKKEEELTGWNLSLGEKAANEVNMRRITNLGTFRAYALRYLKNHPGINQQMTMIVRQLSPTAEGLPLEIYCFTNNTAWVAYEGIQSDIFDHLLSILPEFGLRVFQNPSGVDFRRLGEAGSRGGVHLAE